MAKVLQWNNRQSYKFGDKVLEGRSWEMLDPMEAVDYPDEDPIMLQVHHSVVISTGETLIIDGTTVIY